MGGRGNDVRGGRILDVTSLGRAVLPRSGVCVAECGAAEVERVWCTCAASRVASRWPSTRQVFCVARTTILRFLSLLNGFAGVVIPVFARTRILFLSCAQSIFESILWSATFLVYHLLSQSARLTSGIDMRQARDIVSTTNLKLFLVCYIVRWYKTIDMPKILKPLRHGVLFTNYYLV